MSSTLSPSTEPPSIYDPHGQPTASRLSCIRTSPGWLSRDRRHQAPLYGEEESQDSVQPTQPKGTQSQDISLTPPFTPTPYTPDTMNNVDNLAIDRLEQLALMVNQHTENGNEDLAELCDQEAKDLLTELESDDYTFWVMDWLGEEAA